MKVKLWRSNLPTLGIGNRRSANSARVTEASTPHYPTLLTRARCGPSRACQPGWWQTTFDLKKKILI